MIGTPKYDGAEMKYEPDNIFHRKQLALDLTTMLRGASFEELDQPGEAVFRYTCNGQGLEILVYSSIVGDTVRGDGEDAIRVCAVYRRRDGQVRGLFKDTRVNRTGEIDKIVERTKDRMRNAYKAVKQHWKDGHVCKHCGAPLFLAKSGKMVCAETCWIKN